MNTDFYNDRMRVTSISLKSSNWVIFTGIPLKANSYKINSGKYYVTIKAKPDALPAQPSIGQHWLVKGLRSVAEVCHGDYLMQQHTYENPENIECQLPETGEQLIQFIAKEKDFKGIGESKARALWEMLGRDLHKTFQNDTTENRERLKKLLSNESIDALFSGYAKYKNLAYCNWMSEHKIPASVQQRLLKHHGNQSIEAIKSNPYLLLGFGMSFGDIDSIAINKSLGLNIGPTDHRRLSSALELAIRKEIEKGHTYTSEQQLLPHLMKLLKEKMLVSKAFESGFDKAQYILNPTTATYHPTAQLLMESVVAKRLLSLASQKDLFDERATNAFLTALKELPYSLTDKQREAVTAALDNAIACITGGAGTGKTTVLRTALNAFKAMGYSIHAVALSGRAAMRLHESVGLKTMTIAALLRQEPIEPDLIEPDHLLVIDEASMIDLPTMYRLVTHLDPSVRIIFTGDPDQLPPIGCGKVLSDIVESKIIANTMLDIVKRQEGSSGVPEYSKLINAGIVPDQLSTGAITFHETHKDQIPAKCKDLFRESPSNSRIMGATKRMVADINQRAQQSVNPEGQRIEFDLYGEAFFLDLRLNDIVLFTQNHYDKGVQNGSLGRLICVNATESEEKIFGKVELDTGNTVDLTQSLLDSMELGYCITLHKAQGSQFPRVIIALQKSRIVDRAWLYTAITRAEAEVHIVGSSDDLKEITQAPSHSHKRQSYLKELLAEKV